MTYSESVDDLVEFWHRAPNVLLDDAAREVLAKIEARVRAEVAEEREELIAGLLALHSPRPVGPHRPEVLQCSYCADLCHSHSGLGCELEGDALYPCATVEIARSFAAGSSPDTTPERCGICGGHLFAGGCERQHDTTPEAKP